MKTRVIPVAWRYVLSFVLLSGATSFSCRAEPQDAQRPSGTEHSVRARSPHSTNSFYIEFRVAEIGTYGHSYVAYGQLNRRGKPAETQYADLHPVGTYLSMAVGHVFPVPANSEWDPDVLKLPVASSFRRSLSRSQYNTLLAAIRKTKSNKQPTWNAVTNNCNHFVGILAQSVGLKVPTDFQLAYSFVPALRKLNEGNLARRR